MVYFWEGLACIPSTEDLKKVDFKAYIGWEKTLSKGKKILKLKKDKIALQHMEVKKLFTPQHYHN